MSVALSFSGPGPTNPNVVVPANPGSGDVLWSPVAVERAKRFNRWALSCGVAVCFDARHDSVSVQSATIIAPWLVAELEDCGTLVDVEYRLSTLCLGHGQRQLARSWWLEVHCG